MWFKNYRFNVRFRYRMSSEIRTEAYVVFKALLAGRIRFLPEDIYVIGGTTFTDEDIYRDIKRAVEAFDLEFCKKLTGEDARKTLLKVYLLTDADGECMLIGVAESLDFWEGDLIFAFHRRPCPAWIEEPGRKIR